MANFSILEALETLCTSVPEWNNRLDELNGQIALRQIELARLTESERPPTRSMKNKGSTESLRPKDGHDNPFLSNDPENPDCIQLNPFDSPKSNHNGFTSTPRSSGAVRRVKTPPKASSNPHPSPGGLTRQSSQPTPVQRPAAALRKRKTESLASNESAAPKYRTRSMIIVYYDSAVQTAFEELVKFVSGSRNAMRKGKMAAKMAEMKRAAEMEVGDDDDDDDEDDGTGNLVAGRGALIAAQTNISIGKHGESLVAGAIPAADENNEDMALPKLKFVSTRQMGPSRDNFTNRGNFGVSVGLLRGYRRAGGDAPDIFDELDKGLEWCQGQCEHAAHQFLRDGECGTEIANIKRKLAEVKESAEKELERLKKQEAESPTPTKPTEERQLKTPHVRRELGALKDLEVDDMEVDDEAVEDLEPPKLVFKRSRDIGR